ncbi:beta-phosphoglucomutase [Ligilactobacillus agilis]|uniref:beta-phosphoglucomutase n=1 Tax=Ligilactobacillus agilis TaxID=1601 RepID=UPI001437910C|nr:beta-phosphoglucomutase [Ligilactobacillus agilis]GET19361.1 beta-phosphoglucomutase [Ligilactobacillus agilis]
MKGALFDLDGVLTDTARYHFTAWKALIQRHFQLELPASLEAQTKGVSRQDSLRAILTYLNLDVSASKFAELAAEKNELYKESLATLSNQDILPGITNLLADLKAHQIKIALASASQNGPFILAKLQLTAYFDAIVDPTKIAHGKPAPDIYLAAASALGLSPSDCVGFEDAVAGIAAINSATAVSIGIGSANELKQADKLFASTQDLKYDLIEQVWQAKHLAKN